MKEPMQEVSSDRINQLDETSKTIQSKITFITPFRCKVVHQLDVTYYGQINKSYQRQGFGILQSLQFDTYFGFWKAGKAEGRGLIIYHQGMVLFGYFRRNYVAGPAIYDHKSSLKMCFVQGGEKTGLAYEYNKVNHKWMMFRYGKNTKVMVKQQHLPISQGLPDMIKVQHSLCSFLTDYLSGEYFRDMKDNKDEKKKQKQTQEKSKYAAISESLFSIDKELVCMGFKSKGCLHGLGCIYSKQKGRLIEAGFYNQGLLQGYGFASKKPQDYEINYFIEGSKQGLSFFHEPNTYTVSEYHKDSLSRVIEMTQQMFRKKQKSYNYEQKDFLSAPNTFIMNEIKEIFDENQRDLADPKNQKFRDKINEREEGKSSTLRRSNSPVGRSKTTEIPQSKALAELLRGITTMTGQEQKTSLSMIRDKLSDFRLERSQVEARELSSSRRQHLLSKTMMLDAIDLEQQSIAQEENPFDGAMLGVNLLLESPPKKFH